MSDFDQEDVRVQEIDSKAQIAQQSRDRRWLCRLVAVTMLGAILVTAVLSGVMWMALQREIRDGKGPRLGGHHRNRAFGRR